MNIYINGYTRETVIDKILKENDELYSKEYEGYNIEAVINSNPELQQYIPIRSNNYDLCKFQDLHDTAHSTIKITREWLNSQLEALELGCQK